MPLLGPYACVGKRLALLEIRRVVGEVLAKYDISFAKSETKDVFLEEKEDTFTTVSGSLPLIFTPREKVPARTVEP
jgi:cytochrome P450 family 628